MRILIIEDDMGITSILQDFFSDKGHMVSVAEDGITGLHLAVVNDYDAIVLDLMLPGMDGVDLCQKLRQEARKNTPVLMLTARDTLPEKLAGFNSGADDYVVKPFALQEIEARLQALTRRGATPGSAIIQVADLVYDPLTRRVRRGERAIGRRQHKY
ncbi:MAG: response regulator transcription factor [Gammaproteobacteria bacterium]|nr:response regulator transcription factor [Gammaproteobacteria bacterium]